MYGVHAMCATYSKRSGSLELPSLIGRFYPLLGMGISAGGGLADREGLGFRIGFRDSA